MPPIRCKISPRAGLSTFLLGSPCATAVVTAAISRTCLVRLSAIILTAAVVSKEAIEYPTLDLQHITGSQFCPNAIDAGNAGLATKPSFGADFLR